MGAIKIRIGDKTTYDTSVAKAIPATKEEAEARAAAEEEKKPRKRRTKKEKEAEEQSELPMTASTTPYATTYNDTQMMLYGIEREVAQSCAELSQDLNEIRSSKTARKKYDNIAQLQSTKATMLSTRISAIKEINATITKGHDLDLRRSKEMKLDNQVDDVKQIQDMYNAFISTPVSQNMQGPFQNPLGPTASDFTAVNPNMQYSMMGLDPTAGYEEYRQNISPDAAMMLIEENPNLEEVIVYDPQTGASSFQVMNTATHQVLSGVPTKSNEMFMPGMQMDFNAGVAHSNDLNESYKIVDAQSVKGSVGAEAVFSGLKSPEKY